MVVRPEKAFALACDPAVDEDSRFWPGSSRAFGRHGGGLMTTIEGVTLSLAVLGAVLGVINTWKALDKDRVKLKVVPKRAIPFGAAHPRLTFCIEVTNLSGFPVTIEEAGVFYKGTERRGAYVSPVLVDGLPWPRRLEARTSVTVYGEPPEPLGTYRLKCAYARTSCGVTARGTSGALKQLASV